MMPDAMHPKARGFTLVELIIVIVVTSVIAVSLMVVIRPTLDAYVDTRARAEMADIADTALRRMLRDVRLAVPNSIRIPNDQCFEMVPTSGGGRYRMGPASTDTLFDAAGDCMASNCSAPVQAGRSVTAFDSLSAVFPVPQVGDFIVINNQTTNDVYAGTNRAQITAVGTPPDAAHGRHRFTIAPTEFPPGYDGGRFTVVAGGQQSVFYICSGADGSLDSRGDGKGTLFRLVRNFEAAYPAACPATSGAAVVATKLRSCTFVYDPNQGATQQSGFIWMELTVARNGEQAHLAVGGHVQNSP